MCKYAYDYHLHIIYATQASIIFINMKYKEKALDNLRN